jgi:Ca2+-binding RTX toxin-like protein
MKVKFLSLTAVLMLLAAALTLFTAGSDNQTNSQAGTAGDDVVTGTDANDKVDSGEGNDNIAGMGGNDFIEAGEGNDLVSGGAGDDKIQGGAGDDYIMGGDGNDTVSGGPGNDYITLGPGDDILVYYLDSNKGYHDFADGGEGDDTLIIVSDNIDDMMKNQIIKYYEQQNMVGADVGHVGKLNMTLGTSDFEHIMFATGFSF